MERGRLLVQTLARYSVPLHWVSKMRHTLLVLLIGLSLLGCDLETSQPLSDPLTAEADEAMYGHWIATQKEQDGTISELHVFIGKHTVKGNPESIMEFVGVGWSPNKFEISGSDDKAYFTVTRIGKTSYLNLFAVSGEMTPPRRIKMGDYKKWASDEKRKCTIVRYQCDGKTLRVWNVNSKIEKRLKEEKQLELDERGGDIVSIESLIRYLRKYGGDELFD